MIEHRDGTTTPVIDASVHIFFGSTPELRGVMREPFKSRGFPDYEMDWYGAPGGEYLKEARGPDGQYPGSDPAIVAQHLFADRGVDVAVLHPMGRGIMPDRHLGTAILAAHNEMLVSRWLDHTRIRRAIPRHHPGQPRRHPRCAARDRQVQGPPPRRADRHPTAVPRAVRQAAVLGFVASRRRRPAGGHPHRDRRGHRVPADPVRTHQDVRAVPGLHVAELHLSPDEPDRRGRVRALAGPEVRLRRRRGRHDDAVHVADGLLRAPAPGADPVGAEDAQRLQGHVHFIHNSLDRPGGMPTSPTNGCPSPARRTW